MMTKERLDELDRLVLDAIDDCQYYGLAENHVLEFWRGAKLIVDELKMETGIWASSIMNNPPETD
ncbi:MAG: hypothetical protein L3K24_16910 [Gammaproteobacteria bacterium]|nr:hypothetical protein [Gammaproteobacteria bacterium]